jgi:F1F0 ATPase subunit 2
MTDVARVGLALLGGAAIGVGYFGGLWLTVRRLPQSSRPVLVAFASFVVRAGLAVGGFVLLAGGDALRLLVALLGFVAARTVVVRRQRRVAALAPGGER